MVEEVAVDGTGDSGVVVEKFSGDRGRLTVTESRVVTYLLSHYYLADNGATRELYDAMLSQADAIESVLNDLGYGLRVDNQYRVAEAVPIAFAGTAQPYKLKMRLSAGSLRAATRYLIARLAVQQARLEAQGETRWFVTYEELVDWMEQGSFLDGSDKERCLASLDKALEDLAAYGFVARSDEGEAWEILPPLPSYMTPEAMDAWVEWFEEQARRRETASDDGASAPDAPRHDATTDPDGAVVDSNGIPVVDGQVDIYDTIAAALGERADEGDAVC